MKNGRLQCKDIPDEVILDACRAFHRGQTTQTPDEALCHRWPVQLILAKMQRLHRRRLIEYGVSLRTAWLSIPGEEKLRTPFVLDKCSMDSLMEGMKRVQPIVQQVVDAFMNLSAQLDAQQKDGAT